ncbi:MAG: flagellar biosynthesis protein FlhF [Bacillota bacterium]|uniref:flagellar biosynthesis protein FlhF n=1 Tax=Desulforudis sp. DRI-14 TaxID=3459793 RepID=UPI00349460AB
MKIKRYLARDMREALGLIKTDLGPDAVIISSRRVRARGLAGCLKPRFLEVTAALDTPTAALAAGGPPGLPRPPEPETLEENIGLLQELAEVKSLLAKVVLRDEREQSHDTHLWVDFLVRREVDVQVARRIVRDAAERRGLLNDNTEASIEENLEGAITGLVADLYRDLRLKKVIVFVGPTGVGKTTTLAKLAGQLVLFGRSVAIVTIDTYRIGAVEQIRTYAEIMGVPLEVAHTPAGFKEALALHDNKDYILVDTAGRPSYSYQQVMQTKEFTDVIDKGLDVVLVLSAPTRAADLARQAEDFAPLRCSKLIVTKIDETQTLGPIVNLVELTQRPVVYVTNGQSVPDDIEAVNPAKLASLVLQGGGRCAGSGT